MQVPSFKTTKIRKDIRKLVDLAPTRGMYSIVLQSIDTAMDELVVAREGIPDGDEDSQAMLKAWDEVFAQFGEREAYYYEAFLEGKDRSVVDAPLFSGDYDGWDFKNEPSWPDIETPWRLANELSTAAALAGADQEFLDDLELRFKDSITRFWENANALIVEQKAIFEEQAGDEAPEPSGVGRVFGFWPILAVGAVALVGAFGAAAGYTAAQSDESEEYVDKGPLGKHMGKAKDVGLGMLIGVAVAVVLMLRIRR